MPLGPGLLDELTRILGPDGLVASEEGRLVYECDMHTFYKGAPDVVALPKSTAEVLAIVRLCRRERVPIVPRGSGTGLIGGAMAPPIRPVPEPRGTMGTRSPRQRRTIATTSAVLSGRATTSGAPL